MSGAVVSTLAQSNWPQFRGLGGGVIADTEAVPESWGPDENIAWKIDIPGRAWSSPIVWEEHVFVLTVMPASSEDSLLQPVQPTETYRARSLGGSMTGADIVKPTDNLEWVLFDVDFDTGDVRWRQTLHTAVPSMPTHSKSTFASETPVTDGDRVYVFLADIGLYAFDFFGNEVWSVDLEWVPRKDWGAASSPILHDGRLYVVNDSEAESYVAAYDAPGSDDVHGSVPSMESFYTMCYPMQPAPDGGGGEISSVPPALTVSVESLTYDGLDGSTEDVFVAPNPWKADIMETFHGATTAKGYFVRFYNVKLDDDIKVFDVGGNLVYEGNASSAGSYDWNLVSRTRNQVSTGIYYWKVGDQSGKLAVIR